VHSSAKPDATVNSLHPVCAARPRPWPPLACAVHVPLLAMGTGLRDLHPSLSHQPLFASRWMWHRAASAKRRRFSAVKTTWAGRLTTCCGQSRTTELVTWPPPAWRRPFGDDVPLLRDPLSQPNSSALPLVHAATPSYKDGHVEGFHAMVYALVKAFGLQQGRTCARSEPAAAPSVASGSAPPARESSVASTWLRLVLPTTRIVWTAVILGAPWGAGELLLARTTREVWRAERSERGRGGWGPKGKANPPRVSHFQINIVRC